jgi:hypothetical protein
MEPTNTGVRQVTPDPELLLLVSRWRARAQEVLAQAETMRDAEARQMMREIAARYEKLAQRVEQQAGRADKVYAISGRPAALCVRERVIRGQESLAHM